MKAGFTHDSVKNASVDWYTPPWIFEKLGVEFDLDPCQPPEGVPWIPAKKRYSIVDDGLAQPWVGRVWLNPPYGKHTSDWLDKMDAHRNGIALVFSRTDCRWFHGPVVKSDAILFLKGRVKFVDGLGVTGNAGAGSGSMLVAWGADNVRALERMRDLGCLVYNGTDTFGRLIAAEREECAKVCEYNADCCNRSSPLYTILSSNAAAIRARGEK